MESFCQTPSNELRSVFSARFRQSHRFQPVLDRLSSRPRRECRFADGLAGAGLLPDRFEQDFRGVIEGQFHGFHGRQPAKVAALII
jgi:inosine/xanthosine triphosphate pyrophosphatase family protein